MKKILIYMNKKQLAPTGGATGYNYNLLCGLKEIGYESQIDFLDYETVSKSRINSFVESIKIPWIRMILKIAKSIIHKSILFYGNNKYAIVDLNQYDIVHFHSWEYMWECKSSLEDYKGKVILTQHSPNRPGMEFFNAQTSFERRYMKWFYNKTFKLDQWALDKADYVFFPCEEAEEPYIKHWPYFTEYKKNNQTKFRYILSGTEAVKEQKSRAEIRKLYNIPEKAKIICYIGRHNEVKGYDLLKEIADDLLQDTNIYFLIAGREGPIKRLHHKRWIEIGWTKDPYSYVSASDVFILPNRETYFDLVMLEVLSLGSIVVASNTGGNKYFDKLKPNGVFLYNNLEEAKNEIKGIFKLSRDEQDLLKRNNKLIFENYFTSKIFAKHYIELVKTL